MMTYGAPLVLIHARHPLQEQVVDAFVPNDLVVDSSSCYEAEFPRILVCTGANACGKVGCSFRHCS